MGKKHDGPRYRKLYPMFWRDPDVQKLDDPEKVVALYCLTSHQTNRIGLFVLSPGTASEDLDTTVTSFLKRLDTVCHTLSWKFDKSCRVLYIPSWWRWNCPDNAKAMLGFLKDLHELPKTPLVKEFITNRKYLSDTVSTGYDEGIAYKEQEQEQENEQEQDIYSAAPPLETDPSPNGHSKEPADPVGFDEFWKAYPTRNGRRVGRKATVERFAKLTPAEAAECVFAARNYAKSPQVRDGFAKDPERFLKADFWRDWLGEPEPMRAAGPKYVNPNDPNAPEWSPN
jgi:hypothetical protein